MLVGVMVLVEVAGSTGGLDYATSAIASFSSTMTISTIFGFINGFVSIYSGSSAVVMPTFIPLIPGLVAKLGVVGGRCSQHGPQSGVYELCFGAPG